MKRALIGRWLVLLTGFWCGSLQALVGVININQASLEQIKLLPLTGEVRATAIVNYRERKGDFHNLSELDDVPGIGPVTLRAISPFVRMNGPTTLREGESTGVMIRSAATERNRILTQPGEVVALPDQGYFDVLSSYIEGARESVLISTFVFKASDAEGNLARQLMERLSSASQRGVHVRVLLEQSDYSESINKDNNYTASRLRDAGVEVLFDSEEVTSHAKLVVVDGRFCFVGSHNLTHSALAANHEFSLLVDSVELANELTGYVADLTPKAASDP